MDNFFQDNPDLKFHLSHPLMKKIVNLKERNFADKDKYDYAPLDYEDAMDSYERVLDIVGDISATIIAPNAESVDEEGPELNDGSVKYARGTSENYDALVKAGMVGMPLPREYNGLNFPTIPYIMSAELVARADGGFSNIWGLQDCAETIYEFGDEDIKEEYLPRFNKGATASMDLTEPDAGSDLQAVKLKATYNKEEDQWYLNGVKRFITNGDSDIALVLARSEEGSNDARGLSLFVYDRKHQAVNVRRIEHKLGIVGSPTCELVFNNAPAKLVGRRKFGLIKYVMSLMNSARLGVGAQSVGLAEAAYREALNYARERSQFGKPIIEFPAVYEMLTNSEVKIKAMRSLLYETGRFVDLYKSYQQASEDRKLESDERKELKYYQKLSDSFTPLLKLISSEYCNQIAYDSLQIHGGSGFMKDYPIQRIYRDARITTIYEGTSQLQVVAAIRGVTTHAYINHIREVYESAELKPELEYLRRTLKQMTDEFEESYKKVSDQEDQEYLDFHSRRLVEMVANIIMGYLLIFDTTRDEKYEHYADLFIKNAFAENTAKAQYIAHFSLKDQGYYKKQ